MSLTVFLAICILGCDVLIYFLYEWAFGESERIRKRRARPRRGVPSPEVSDATPMRKTEKAANATVIEMRPRPLKPTPSRVRSDDQERRAYHRIATSHAPVKRHA